ncbi:GNAT family N-acetyltransferase [Simplicispira piscis]
MAENAIITRMSTSPLDIAAADWNALLALQAQPTPFMRHEYLAALHESGSATPRTGWTPRFLSLWQGDVLWAACPLYVKSHSYGEYVFDWTWANAYAEHGLPYYPKAVVAVPFTPVPGTRLMARNCEARAALVQALRDWCTQAGVSSLHLLFADDTDMDACKAAGLMQRQTVQFHWKNVAPTLGTGVSSLPPEGALAALGRPGGGSMAPTLGTGVSSLPPEGALAALGRPGGGSMAPTLGTAVSSLPPEGALAALGRPGGGSVAPTLGTGVSSLPPEGALAALGRPGGGSMAPTLGTGVSSLPPEGALAALGRPGGGSVAYRDFDDFLSCLSQEKRKKIRQERRRVADAGVRFEWRQGTDIASSDWDFFYRCYERTYLEHGNLPYLTRDFFRRMAAHMPEAWLLFIAERNGQPIASSLIAISVYPSSVTGQKYSEFVAYGRYWGALERVDCLHFEACYYQPLQWCIAHGVQRFEGGAQGEHKMARALLPVPTHSAHWLAHPAFADAVGHYLEREGVGMANYLEQLQARNPLRTPD